MTDNLIQPFQLETSSLRGRIVQIGSVLDEILSPHDYPDIISQLLGECVTLCSLLSSMLKYEGIFTLQTQGDGPVNMLIADITSDGAIRACAGFNRERLEQATQQLAAFDNESGSNNQMAQLLGKGHIAFTVDQGEHSERYQGIVELKGASLVDCVQHYFNQSEQIGTGIKMAVGQHGGNWRAAGIMLQHLPEDKQNPESGRGNLDEDDWRRSMILMESCTKEEFLDPAIDSNNLLIRLFHEEGVRVFEALPITKNCRCTQDKVEGIIMMMSEADRKDMVVDNAIVMTCEFCNKDFTFDPKDIDKKIKTVVDQDAPS